MSTTTLVPEVASEPADNPRSPAKRRRSVMSDNPLHVVITRRADRTVIYALLALMGLVFAFPLYAMVSKSLDGYGLRNYTSLLTEPIGDVSLLSTYLNSFVIGAMHGVVVVVVSTSAGYALSQLRWRGREISFVAILLFLAVPGTALIIPVYHITSQLGLFNNFVGVALPEAALTIPFGVLLMRNYGSTLSPELVEAATLDGAGDFQVFWHVFLPLARPAVVNLIVLCFIWSLQDFLWPSMLFTDPSVTTAAQAVSAFSNVLGRGTEDFGRYNASLVLLAVPAALFVLFGLRFIVNGLTSGSSKE
jgi:raffinose/stachyose/melibiose transport system permease protein